MIIRQEEETDYSEIYDLARKSFATADYCAGDEHEHNAEWCMAREINEGYLKSIRGCVDIV